MNIFIESVSGCFAAQNLYRIVFSSKPSIISLKHTVSKNPSIHLGKKEEKVDRGKEEEEMKKDKGP